MRNIGGGGVWHFFLLCFTFVLVYFILTILKLFILPYFLAYPVPGLKSPVIITPRCFIQKRGRITING